MADIRRTALFSKLDPLAYKSVEGATLFCKMRGNPYVELVHWIHQILQGTDSDFHRIIRYFELNPSRVASELTEALDKLPRGATAISDFSPILKNPSNAAGSMLRCSSMQSEYVPGTWWSVCSSLELSVMFFSGCVASSPG